MMAMTETSGIKKMHIGILERVLTRRYGPPAHCIRDGMAAKGWNNDQPSDESLLYLGMKWQGLPGNRFASLKEIYGNSYGGFIIGDSLRTALLTPREVFALWNMDDFRHHPAVQYAISRDPAIDFFMDQNNIWFYGVKKSQLYVFDSEFDELDCLGPVEQALETVIDELEAARRDD
jgi:hypothetical protein